MSYIEIDLERCKGCQYCVTICKPKVLETSRQMNKAGYNYSVFTDIERIKCNACMDCALMCPETAIEVFK